MLLVSLELEQLLCEMRPGLYAPKVTFETLQYEEFDIREGFWSSRRWRWGVEGVITIPSRRPFYAFPSGVGFVE